METLPLEGAERRTGQGLGRERTIPMPGPGLSPHTEPSQLQEESIRGFPMRQDCQVSRKHTSPGRHPHLEHQGQQCTLANGQAHNGTNRTLQLLRPVSPLGGHLGHRPLPPVPLLPAPPWVASHPRRSDTSSPTAPRPGHTRDISRPGMQCGLSPEPQSIFTLSVLGTGLLAGVTIQRPAPPS